MTDTTRLAELLAKFPDDWTYEKDLKGRWSVYGHFGMVAQGNNNKSPITVEVVELIVAMKNNARGLLSTIASQAAEIERLRVALESLVKTTGEYVSTGSDKAGYAEMIRRMKRDVDLGRKAIPPEEGQITETQERAIEQALINSMDNVVEPFLDRPGDTQ